MGSQGCPQHFIQDVGLVSGYCPSCNTVYEFRDGRYNPTTVPYTDDLYVKVIAKDNTLIKLGYKLKVVWLVPNPEYQTILKANRLV